MEEAPITHVQLSTWSCFLMSQTIRPSSSVLAMLNCSHFQEFQAKKGLSQHLVPDILKLAMPQNEPCPWHHLVAKAPALSLIHSPSSAASTSFLKVISSVHPSVLFAITPPCCLLPVPHPFSCLSTAVSPLNTGFFKKWNALFVFKLFHFTYNLPNWLSASWRLSYW